MAECFGRIGHNLPALVLDYPHGLLILTGRKKKSLHKRRVEKYLGKPVLLVENEHALAVIKLSGEERVGRREALARVEEHQVTREELDRWFPEVEEFYLYDIEVLEEFPRPRKVRLKQQGFPWVSRDNVEFRKSGEDLGRFLRLAQETLVEGEEIDYALRLLLAAELTDLTPEELASRSPCELETLERAGKLLLSGEELQNFLAVVAEARGLANFSEASTLPVPSEKEGPMEVRLDEVLEILSQPAMLYHNAVCVVGGLATRGEGHDVDILVRQEVPKELFRRVAFRIGRVLNTLGVPVHILRDAGPFTSYLPLYDIWLVPSREREVVQMAKVRTLKPFVFVPTMKPIRVGLGAPQTKENFLALVAKHGPEGYIEPKYDGVCVHIHGKGGQVRIWTEDGQEITELLPQLQARWPKQDFIILGELETWKDGKHLPREYTAGHVHAKRSAMFTLTVFDLIYLDGPLHGRPFAERRRALESLAKDVGWPLRKDIPQKPGVYLGRSRPVESLGEVREALAEVLKEKEFEGVVWKKKDGSYYLDGNPRGTQVKWHRNVTIPVLVVERHPTKTKGVYNYSWGLPVEDPEHWLDVRNLAGQRVHVSGKTFSTNIRFEPGDVIFLELETLTLEKEGGKFRLGGWAPKIVKDANTLSG